MNQNRVSNALYLIEILHQTTTTDRRLLHAALLYLIEILHQTTTCNTLLCPLLELYLIEILHQTTTPEQLAAYSAGCILSKFYIKPQQRSPPMAFPAVVSYRNSTSNHNPLVREKTIKLLYLIEILHQTTTGRWKVDILLRCILSKFYIKPQRAPGCSDFERVVSYRNSTSNHNVAAEYYAAQVVVSYRNSTSNHNLVPIIS